MKNAHKSSQQGYVLKRFCSILRVLKSTFKRKKSIRRNLNPCKFGGVAQLGEHLPCTQGVRSSILLISTKQEFRRGTTVNCMGA